MLGEIDINNERRKKLNDLIVSKNKEITEIISGMPPEIENLSRAFHVSKAIRQLGEIFEIQEVKNMILELCDNPLGFVTDKANSQAAYPWPTIRNACVHATIAGARLTGGEFNIIAGRFYSGKAHKFRMIYEYPGVTDFKYRTSPAQFIFEDRMGYNGLENVCVAVVHCWASWKLNGEPNSIGDGPDDTLVFKIKVNKGMGDDGVIGKALSKLFGRVLSRISGSDVHESGDFEGVAATPVSEIVTVSEERTEKGLEPIHEPIEPIYEPIPKKLEFDPDHPKTELKEKATADPEKDFLIPIICDAGKDSCPAFSFDEPSHCNDPDPMRHNEFHFIKNKCEQKCFRAIKAPNAMLATDVQGTEAAKKRLGIETASTSREKWSVYFEWAGLDWPGRILPK